MYTIFSVSCEMCTYYLILPSKTAKYIAKQEFGFEGDILKPIIDAVLSEK